jgi:hypothetical protein
MTVLIKIVMSIYNNPSFFQDLIPLSASNTFIAQNPPIIPLNNKEKVTHLRVE